MSELDENRHYTRRLKHLALYVMLAAIAVAAWGIVTRLQARAALERATEAATVQAVNVVKPHHSNSANELVLPGDVEAYTDAPIYARTSGYLKRWYADIGKQVKAGDALADIETPEVDAQYRQAKADLATAEANYRLAQTTAARYQELRKTGLVAVQDVDNAQGDADAKTAQLESARQNLQRLAQLESFNHITAPFDGVVTARRIDIGALVTEGSTSGQELFHMTATRRLRVYVQVPQAYASLIQPGLIAELNFAEHPDRRFPAKVVSTARAIDVTTRTLLTELEADNSKGELLSGAFAQVHLPLPLGLTSWRLPSNTLLFRADGLHVATVDANNRVQLNTVRIGRDFGSEIEILSGVGPDDRVILNPADSLLSGTPVRVAAAAP
ncbi:MAG: efflux RND transporter periplasmic adaptor subunit [Steroidobacterales bacterium]